MVHYYGTELLDQLNHYYSTRLKLAFEQGFQEKDSQYNWLFEELKVRVQQLRQARLFLDALLSFMTSDAVTNAFKYVSGYLSKVLGGQGSQLRDKDSPFFKSQNVYWSDLKAAMDQCGVGYSLELHPLLYIDLCEVVVCGIRLYFQIREATVSKIDGCKFDSLMSGSELLPDA